MWCKIKQFFSWLLILSSLILLVYMMVGNIAIDPAAAAVRFHEEAPGQMLYQSRQTLRDNNGNSWQLVLFKRVKSQKSNSLNLRLVGFPGTIEFEHPQTLKLTTQNREFWAEDRFAEKSPAANVGQYDLEAILPQLSLGQAVKLELPVKSSFPLSLAVPSEVILEWKDIASKGN
jgi:hypothetical protein